MGKNLYQKVIEAHTVARFPSGIIEIFIGTHFVNEVTSPLAFALLKEQNLKVKFPSRTFAAADHVLSTLNSKRPYEDPLAEEMMKVLENNSLETGINFSDPLKGDGGIIHVVGPENGISQPGMTIACGDSHTSTHGAFGAVSFGLGTSQVRNILATQTLYLEPLKVRQIRILGKLRKGTYAKDVILYIIQKLGVNKGIGYVYEFSGPVFESMSMDERLTICNMAVEAGARTGYINPDRITYNYLKYKKFAPKNNNWKKALEYWESMKSDPDAEFDDVVIFNGEDIGPIVTWGITPGQSATVNETIPELESIEKGEQLFFKEALQYMSFTSGQPLKGVPVDVAFIGSCTNGRLSDLKTAALIVRGRQVDRKVKAYVVPGSYKVKEDAEKLGLDKIFKEAGFEWRYPGCSFCIAMNEDRLTGRQLSASSSNRNFKGRQGSSEGRTMIMSPAMVACAAITGKISDVRDFL